MLRLTTVTIALLAVVGVGCAQGLVPPQQLTEVADDLAYVELLNAAELNADQISALLRMQLLLQVETMLAPDVSAAFSELRGWMIGGASQQEAMEALGPMAQLVQQAQARYGQMIQERVTELQGTLTEAQRAALAWHESPAQHLENAAGMVAHGRQMPDDQWAQMKPQIAQMIAQLVGQAEGGEAASPDAVAKLLEAARSMKDADFDQKRASLGKDWAAAVMPNTVKRIQDPAFQEQQAGQVCQRLISYARGHLLVQAKMDTMAQQ